MRDDIEWCWELLPPLPLLEECGFGVEVVPPPPPRAEYGSPDADAEEAARLPAPGMRFPVDRETAEAWASVREDKI